VWLLWAILYYRIARKYPVKLPLRSWLLTVLPPVLSITALIYLWDVAETLLETGINIHGSALVVGIFLFLLNCFLFYWYISILANSAEKVELRRLMAEAQEETAVPQSGTNSNWSRKAGLSEAFVAKYQFSAQERRALELVVLSKVDKEIAKEMGVALSTVKSYMHSVYAKTNTYGRGGVFSLIHGGGQL
jgi:DNA-binding CsgD family transcriptional regulator